jgi:hypothetical protein
VAKFPYPGYPIAPRSLRPILCIGLPASFARLADAFPLMADLDDRVWAYVDQSAAEHLAYLVVSRASQMRSAEFWRVTYFPQLTQRVQLEDIQLEQPTYEAMRSLFLREIPDGLAGLSHFSLGQLISEVPGFGVKPLVDLLAAVNFYIDDSPISDQGSERLTKENVEVIIRTPSAWRTYSHKYFPILPITASQDDLGFSARADNCVRTLVEDRVIPNFSGLSQLTLRQVMKRHNFGAKSLGVLLKEIRPLILQPLAPVKVPLGPVAAVHKSLSREDVRNLISKPQSCRLLWDRTFPEIPSTTNLTDLALSVRTYNCLCNLIEYGVISRPSDLSGLTIGKMMRVSKNFGVTSLADLLNALDRIASYSGAPLGIAAAPEQGFLRPLSPDLTWAASKLSASRFGGRVRANDPRMQDILGELLYSANNLSGDPPIGPTATLAEIARRLAARSRDPESPSDVMDLIEQIRLRLSELVRMSLDEELRSFAAQHLKGRNLELMLILFGWTGDAPKTLQSAGDVFGLTRERVRQIQAKFFRKSRHAKAFLPTLERVLRFLASRLPALADVIEGELCIAHLTSRRFRVESIIEAAKLTGLPTPLVIDGSADARLLLTQSEGTGLARLIAMRARRAVSKYGVANFAEMKEELTDIAGSFGDLKLVSGVIGAMPSYEDLGQGWFWLREGSRNHMLTIVRKIFAVAPRIHLGEMRAAIANDPRGMGFAPPKGVVMRFCQSAADCAVDDDFLEVRQPVDPDSVLSETERIFFSIFCAHGPLLRREDIEKLCIERGMNRSTLGLYLGRLAILARFSIGVYGLRGAISSPGELEQLSIHRQSRYADHGWTENAQPWAAVELPPSALANGIVQLPASFRQQMKGRYLLKTEDGLTVGTLVVSDQATWGLGPLFRRRGGEPGDILLLTFDLRQREVTARLGDLTVLPEPGSLAEEIVD